MSGVGAFTLTGLVKQYPGFTLGPIDLTLEPGTVLGLVGSAPTGRARRRPSTASPASSCRRRAPRGVRAQGGQPLSGVEVGHRGRRGDARVLPVVDGGGEPALPVPLHAGVVRSARPSPGRPARPPARQEGGAALEGSPSPSSRWWRRSATGRASSCWTSRPPGSTRRARRVLDVLREVLEDGEHAIFYSTHVLSDIARLAGRTGVPARGERAAAQLQGRPHRALGAHLVPARRGGRFGRRRRRVPRVRAEHQVVSHDRTRASPLRELGAEAMEQSRMTIDEIAVAILRGGHHVAAS